MTPLKSIAVVLLPLLFAGCSMFSGDKLPPLPGERISILPTQNDLQPDPVLKDQLISLPEAWNNAFWPQAGCYPDHAPGHLSLDGDLEKAWSVSVGKGGDRRTPLMAAPVVAEDTVFTIDSEGNVSAFELKDGKQKWRQSVHQRDDEDSGAIGGGLAYASGRLYVTSGYEYLLALNPANGNLVWKSTLPSPARAAPTVMDGKVYLVTMDNRMMVFDGADGTPLWHYSGISESTNLLGSASPAADKSLIVLPLSSGEILGLRPENGQVVWEDNLASLRKTGPLSSISDIRGLPVISKGLVFVISYSGRMVAIDQISGVRTWQREIGGTETPWIAGDIIYVVTSEQQLVALSRESGDIYWVSALSRYKDEEKLKPILWTGPVLAGGRLILANNQGEMLEVDAATGKTLKSSGIGGAVAAAPFVANGSLFVLTDDGTLTVYR